MELAKSGHKGLEKSLEGYFDTLESEIGESVS